MNYNTDVRTYTTIPIFIYYNTYLRTYAGSAGLPCLEGDAVRQLALRLRLDRSDLEAAQVLSHTSVLEIVLQKSNPLQIRQLIVYISTGKG
jgi:hypothetical protein